MTRFTAAIDQTDADDTRHEVIRVYIYGQDDGGPLVPVGTLHIQRDWARSFVAFLEQFVAYPRPPVDTLTGYAPDVRA